MGCWGQCDLVDDGAIFKPLSKRCCTDILCLLFFLVYLVAQLVIAFLAITNGDMNYIMYPKDYLGQYCTADLPGRTKAFYPRLDKDLQEQAAFFAAGPAGFYYFQPYTLCVAECPAAFSLSNPETYGGPTYPGAATDAPSFYAGTATTDIFDRCLPRTDTQPGLDRQLCGAPACNDEALATCLGFAPECTVGENAISSDPSVTTAWYVDNATMSTCCDFEVSEVNTQTFLPADATAESRAYERQFAAYVSSAFGVFRAVSDSSGIVLIMGLAAPIAFAFVWFILLFCFAGLLVVLALLIFFVALLALTAYLYYKAGFVAQLGVNVAALTNFSAITSITATSTDDISPTIYAILAVLSTIGLLFYLVFLCLSRQAIFRCIAIIREVTKVFFALPFMTLWPLVGVAFVIGVVMYAFFIGCLIMTSNANSFAEVSAALEAEVSIGNSSRVTSMTDAFNSTSQQTQMTIMMIIHIVGCLWAFYITQTATYMTLSRSAAVWYFGHGDDGNGGVVQKLKFFSGIKVVLICAWCVISRHLGSAVFAAAILTIIKSLRIVLGAIDHYTQDMQDSNLLLKVLMKCVQCCLWCFEKTVKFITYYGLIFVAVEGDNFCKSCFSTFKFICNYPGQMSVNALVARILSFVISLSIPVAAAAISFFWVDAQVPTRPGPVWVSLSVFILAFVIASAVTDVFRCCIDTIFVSAFKDMAENTPPKYMSTSLRSGFELDKVEPDEGQGGNPRKPTLIAGGGGSQEMSGKV